MLPYQIIAGGSFTSDSTLTTQVQVTDQPDLIWLRDRTGWGSASAVTAVESWWRTGMSQGTAQGVTQAVTTNALSSAAITTLGFSVYNTTNPPTFAATALTAITAANPAVASVAATGSIVVGSVVRVTSTTGMEQIAGYEFSVTAVTTNTSVTLLLDASGFAAPATAGNIQLFIPSRFYPRWRYIVPVAGGAGITKATQAVVTTSVYHDFTVGEVVSFRVSSAFGMKEINNVQGRILAVGTMSGGTFTAGVTGPFNAFKTNIDTSGFTTFAMPTSAIAAAGVSPAVVVPVGAGPYPSAANPFVPTAAAFDNRSIWLINMGPNIITNASHVFDWYAAKFDIYTAQ